MRLRTFELPMDTEGELVTTPFLVVIDRVDEGEINDPVAATRAIKEQTGARGVVIFAGEVELG